MGHSLRLHPPVAAPPSMFDGLPASARRTPRRVGLAASMAAHAVALTLIVLAPLLTHEALPEHRDYVRALLYGPPPPPPPPPPKGSPAARATPSVRPTPPPISAAPSALRLPEETLRTETAGPVPSEQAMEVWGSPEGSEAGVAEGMEGGVPGGTVGGVPGGVLGGVIGGDGDLPAPVRDYDRPPRLLTQTKPVYPDEAFKRKIEGRVLIEILIGADGRVRNARVVQSVPVLDAAALASVRQWTFAPAIKNGRPVATIATAPVTFRIY